MILNIPRFVQEERKYWEELEDFLEKLQKNPDRKLNLDGMKRFHYLYERASAGLAKLATFSTDREIRRYLESLVSRAYGEIHESRSRPYRISPLRWFLQTFPQTFRRHIRAFQLSCLVFFIGTAGGSLAILADHNSKEILMPFSHLQMDPSDRVQREEQAKTDRLAGAKTSFSAFLMTHNTKVSILTLGLGITFGIGTVLMLFSNGVMLGAVAMDYVLAGETLFLSGWLLPHGVIEIPAVLIAGQAGLVLASALMGRRSRVPLRFRLRAVSADLATLIGGVAILLIWAGLVEAFLSQYHEPVIPYSAKIVFGMSELLLLTIFLSKSGNVTAEEGLLENGSGGSES